MPSDDRDKQFERALARHLRSGELDAACPDPETLAAYHERAMSLEEMSRWKEHIAGCARCQEALALVEQSEAALAEEWQDEKNLVGMSAGRNAAPALVSPSQATRVEETATGALAKAKTTEIRKAGRVSRWTVPIGAIAAALLVWIGLHEFRQAPEKTAAPVKVAENRETQLQERDLPLQERAPGAPAEEKADTAKAARAPAKDAKTQPRPATIGGMVGGMGGGIGSGSAPKPELSLQSRGATNSPARQDSSDRGASRVIIQGMAPALPVPAPPPSAASAAGGTRATTPSSAERSAEKRAENAPAKGATGGPLINNQANQQANQQANEQTAQNANATLKKEEAEKQKAQAATVEVSTLTTGATTLNKLPMNLRDMANITPSVIVAPDNKNAWRVGAGGKIEHSGNGGNSWKVQPSGVKQDLIAGTAPSKKICWVVGKNGTLLLTTDGGKHWARILSPIRGDLGGVHAQDEEHASIWDVTNREGYETSDGGATWKSTANE
jgi:Photosynthesis system II assembly factor YCF48